MLDRHPGDRLERQLSLGDATMLIVASVIGAGIFFTPGRVAELLPHPGWIFAAWVVGGLLSVAGALANAELGASYPHAGGDYVYLREAFHPVAGFLVGWLTFFAVYCGTIAALAAAFAQGIGAWIGLSEGAGVALAVGVTLAVSALNYVGLRWGARANNITSILKIAALVAFVVLGPWIGEGDLARLWSSAASAATTEGPPSLLASFGLAMSPILFTYLGWNAVVYVASEVREPGRIIPASLFWGLGICTGIYLLVNGVYLYALPMEALQGAPDAGRASAAALFGERGGTLVAVFVLASVLGTLNATILVGPRVVYAMALDGLFFRSAGQVHAGFRTPSIAIALQALVSAGLLLLLRNFPSALDYTTFAILLASMADVLALYRLRRTQPDRPRPYRAWGYPWVPALYLVAIGGLVVALLWGRPLESLAGLAMLAAGLPFYWLFRRRDRA